MDKALFRNGFKERRYFDWAAGVRGTDESRQVARKAFERMERMRFPLEEGQAEARSAREAVCRIIFPDRVPKPENVIFANSATMALVHLLAALGRSEKEGYRMLISMDAYSPMARFLVGKGTLDAQHDAAFKLRKRPLGWYIERLPRQNYGSCQRVCRAPKNEELVGAWQVSRNPVRSISYMMRLENRWVSSEFVWDSIMARERRPALLVDLISGEGIIRDGIRPVHDKVKESGGLTILDISHSFGLYQLPDTLEPDILIGSSSKIAGAEPTIGFALVSDEVLETIRRDYIGKESPFRPLAFQFDPSIALQSSRSMVSLPELVSFSHALRRMMGERNVDRARRLASYKSGFLDLLLEKAPRAASLILENGYCHDADRSGAGALPSMAFIRLETLRPDLLSGGQPPVRMAMEVMKAGFMLKTLRDRYGLHAQPSYEVARISFNPYVEPDIEGFTDVLAKILR